MNAAQNLADDDGALSAPAAWRVGATWHIRFHTVNSHGDPDVAEYALEDDEVSHALLKLFGCAPEVRS